MITFNTDNMLPQKFPFPAPLMDYIFKNVTGSQALKLFKTCKWFYDKFRLNIVENFELGDEINDERVVGNSLGIFRRFPAYMQLNNLWITKSFTYREPEQPAELNYGMFSRLTYDTLHILSDITLREYEFLVQPDTLRNLVIGGRIRDPVTGENLSIEETIERAPQVAAIELYVDKFRENALFDSFSPLDMTKLMALDRQTKLISLQLFNIPKVPDPLRVIEFFKEHAVPDIDYYFDFDKFDDEYDPDNVKTFYETVNAELCAWKLIFAMPPVITSSFIDLTGKVAVITGAGEGIGRATTLLFRKLGASVIAVSQNRGQLDTLIEECQHIKNNGSLHTATPESYYSFQDMIHTLFERINYKFGSKCDILVNIADNLGRRIIPYIYEIGNSHRYTIMQQTEPYLIEAKGTVINVLIKSKFQTLCTKSLELYLATSGVRINTVNPNTPVAAALPRPGRMSDADYKKYLKESKKIYDEQAANAIAFLASDAAKLINKSTLNVNPMNLH